VFLVFMTIPDSVATAYCPWAGLPEGCGGRRA